MSAHHSPPKNQMLLQTFEWHTPSSPPAPHETHSQTSHYARLISRLPSLSALGVTSIWLPPGCKANNPQGNGYDCYDLWDLGEFDQKFTRSTKWGSREELDDLLGKAKEMGLEVIWDAVLNHKTAGDRTDEAWAVEVDNEDRRYEICPPRKIEAWLRYDFPGREREGMKYSKMKWRAEHFNGTDWDQRAQKHALYKLIDDPGKCPKPFQQPQRSILVTTDEPQSGMNRLVTLKSKLTGATKNMTSTITRTAPLPPPPQRPGKGWASDVDDQHGNYDYLMFSNIDYTHSEVCAEVLNWGHWMLDDVGVDGFRLDAVQHYSYSFTREWVQTVQAASRRKSGKDVFVVGEIWTGEVKRILKWLDAVQQRSGPQVHAYDSPLLYNFSRISEDTRTKSVNADLRTIMRDSLLELRPQAAVTLVTNHDTQPGQTSYTPMLPLLKPLFYAFVLLRKEGLPCVFWGDLFGTSGPHPEKPVGIVRDESRRSGQRNLLAILMLCRKNFAHGEQRDYWDAMSCIGFTRDGVAGRPGSGCVVILSIGSINALDGKAGRNSTMSKQQNPTDFTVKKMAIGEPGEMWVDVLGNVKEAVKIDRTGHGVFPCKSMSASVYVKSDAVGLEQLKVDFDTHIHGP